MSAPGQVRLKIRRAHGWQEYSVPVQAGAYVLDALEAALQQDPTLLFRHACHHASCGSCGLRVNGRERLACITPLAEVTRPGQPVRLEPLRNFPVIGDLLVDFGPFLHRLAEVDLPPVRSAAPAAGEGQPAGAEDFFYPESRPVAGFNRLENCIECGLCLSACPVAASDPAYLGPAALASAGRLLDESRGRETQGAAALADRTHGAWRCHGAFECTQVCPAGVDPAREIMLLRRKLMRGNP